MQATSKMLPALLLAISLGASDAYARIKLITLPVRERVEIQLDHPDVTLVEEERLVPLVEGLNQVDFSWANTAIDPATLVFRVLQPENRQGPEEVNVLAVSYPPNEASLIWSVYADAPGAARVRISYLLGALSKHFHYRAVASRDETELTLSQYVRIENNANEDFSVSEVWAGVGEQFSKPIGLNETKEVLVGKFRQVAVNKTYTVDPLDFGYLDRRQNKLNVPLHYVIENKASSGLGLAPLPYGKVRIFQDGGNQGIAFLGEDWGRFTPIDDELTLNLGLARDIAVKRTIGRRQRERIGGNLYRYDVVVQYEIENFKETASRLRMVENVDQIRQEIGIRSDRDPQWRLGSDTTVGEPDTEHSDYQRLLFEVELAAKSDTGKAEKIIHKLHLLLENEW